jgi:hypothetical protein
MISSKKLICLLVSASAMTIPALGFFVKEADVIKGMAPDCPVVNHYQHESHRDTACDRAGQNVYKDSLNRHGTRAKLQAVGTGGVPSQKTSFCPQTVEPLASSGHVTGFDTAWVIENTAATRKSMNAVFDFYYCVLLCS